MKVTKLLRILIPIVILSLVWSCNKKPETKATPKAQKLTGAWILSGLLQTNNSFHAGKDWKNNHAAIMKSDSIKIFYNQRSDLYTKLDLKANNQFTTQLFDIKTDSAFDKAISGTWKLENNQLKLSAKATKAQASLEQIFDITDYNDKVLKLKIIKEVTSEVGKSNPNYDLADRQKKFDNIIKEIGINQNDLTTKDLEYNSDFWTVNNFNDHQLLTRRIGQDQDISKYSKDLQSLIYGVPWDYVPYYEPIFENRSVRFSFLPKSKLDIEYQIDGSASGWCGTPAQGHYFGTYHYNKTNKLMEISFTDPKIPKEVQRTFRYGNKSQKYQILAKNDYVMIWKKL
ncbi:DUF5004 domain-containing protein [Soonwooa sp.]|uniref:DUF5004 domain-containing protein n=1 Tax=Soonwooa sp. TaxID=1938592 RepID=UPI0028AB3BE8|nr:DUF5004 domain-containing protein [Soonwooa sp.]